MLEEDFEFFKKNLATYIEKYSGKYVVIHKKELVGVYDSYNEALEKALDSYKLGEFLIQQCIPADETSAHFFNSYVITDRKNK